MRFLIQDDAVRRQAANLGVTVEGLQKALQRYSAAVGALPSTWVGTGATVFREFDQQYRAASQGLVTSLRTMRAEVDAAGLDYAGNEADQKAAVDALAAGQAEPGGAQAQASADPPQAARDQDRDGGFLGIVAGAAGWAVRQQAGVAKGFGEAVVGMGQGLWMLGRLGPQWYLIDPEGWRRNVEGLGNAIGFAVSNPGEFGKAVINWEDLAAGRYGEWVGNLGPDALITAATLGAGGAAVAGGRGARAAGTLGKLAKGRGNGPTRQETRPSRLNHPEESQPTPPRKSGKAGALEAPREVAGWVAKNLPRVPSRPEAPVLPPGPRGEASVSARPPDVPSVSAPKPNYAQGAEAAAIAATVGAVGLRWSIKKALGIIRGMQQ